MQKKAFIFFWHEDCYCLSTNLYINNNNFKKMANLTWAGIISKGILKMKLAFDKNVKVPERIKIMEHWAQEVSHSDINIIETQHYDTMSSIKAVIKRPSKQD
jgi:acyl-ACP thioesterase